MTGTPHHAHEAAPSRPLFVGAVIPVLCDRATVFSLVHALEHQLVDALALDLRDTGAVVSGFTTTLGLHLDVEALAEDEASVVARVRRCIESLANLDAIGIDAKQEVAEELRGTPAYSLACRRLERWLHRAGALHEAADAELDALVHPMPAVERELIDGLRWSDTMLVVAADASHRISPLFRDATASQAIPVEPLRWSADEPLSVVELPLTPASYAAVMAALPAVCRSFAQVQIPFALIPRSGHALMAFAPPAGGLPAGFLQECFRASFEAGHARFGTALLDTAAQPIALGRFLLERALHADGFGDMTLPDLSRHCVDDVPLAGAALARAFTNLRTLTEGGIGCTAFSAALHRGVATARAGTAVHDLHCSALAVQSSDPARLLARFGDLPTRFKSCAFEVFTFLDHVLVDAIGPKREVEALSSAWPAIVQAHAWACVAIDAQGGVSQQRSPHGPAELDISAPRAPSELATAPDARRVPCAAAFRAPGLFAPGHDEHMALAHALLHKTGLLSADGVLSELRGWFQVGLTRSAWGFSAAIAVDGAGAPEARLRRVLEEAVRSHCAIPYTGARARRVRELGLRGGMRGRTRSMAQALLASVLAPPAGRPELRFPPAPYLLRCGSSSGRTQSGQHGAGALPVLQ